MKCCLRIVFTTIFLSTTFQSFAYGRVMETARVKYHQGTHKALHFRVRGGNDPVRASQNENCAENSLHASLGTVINFAFEDVTPILDKGKIDNGQALASG